MQRRKLEEAAEKGIINKTQVEPLLSFLNGNVSEERENNSEEQLRFVRSFGDIFITLGIVFVMVAGAKVELSTFANIIPLLISIATAEWLVRKRRLALPGIALLIAIIYFASRMVGFSTSAPALDNVIILTGLGLLFYWRYKMPFTLMPIAIGVITIISLLIEIDITEVQAISTVYGLLVFSVAMWFDSNDTKRQGRLSDSAFWLHLLAAPLVVHGVMSTLLTSSNFVDSKEILIVAFFVVFFLVALYVDRRALLVSSLSYAIYAVIQIANNNGQSVENLTLVVFVAFGAFIVFFGANWYLARNIIFSKTNRFWLSNYVPDFTGKKV